MKERMNKMPTIKKKAHVRLTDNAHTILSDLADKYSISQKEIASEAIIALSKRENRMQVATLTIRRLKKRERETAIAGTILGIAFSIVIGFIFGVI